MSPMLRLSLTLLMTSLPLNVAHANVPGESPDVLLGTTLDDSRFMMPFSLVRNESITIQVQVERGLQGDAIACRLLSQDVVLSADNGTTCHLSAQGFGLRHYVLQVINLDPNGSHQVFITANRGKSHHE